MHNSFDNLSSQRKKYLESCGINESNIPASFFDIIQSTGESISNAERFMLSGDDFVKTSKPFSLRDLVGTDHSRYSGKSWFEAFLDLDRGDEIIEMYFNNPQYYDGLRHLDQSQLPHDTSIGLIEKDGKYYLSQPGGGNNRMILMKIKYLSLISQANGDQNKINEIDKQFTFVGKVKTLPKERETASIYYDISVLTGLYKEKIRNISSNPDTFVFKVEADGKIFDSVSEEQLPRVFDEIKAMSNPISLQTNYDTYDINLDTKNKQGKGL